MMRHLLLFVLFLSSGLLHAESQVPRSILDLTLEPTEINFNPGPEYSEEQQDYAMVIGMDRTPKGRLWAAWVGGGDSPLAYFIAATSDDDGKTWSHPRMVIRPGRTVTGLNRSVIVGNFWTDPTGRLWLFYDQSLEQFDGRAGVWAITCENPDDANPTWSAPRRIWHGMSLNKPTVLSNGDWMLPVSLWDRGHIKPVFGDAYKELDDQRMAHWFASSDQGKTWTRRGGVAFPKPRFDEHMLVELKDGRLRMLARNGDGIMESYSSDMGRTWTEPVPSEIKNPSARFFFRRLQSGNLLLVKNGPLDRKFERTHMTAYLSDDEGKTWKGGLVIDEREDVSYPDGFQAPDGRIYIIHDRERSKQREILFAKFTEADILAKDYVTEGSSGKIPVFKGRGARKGAHLSNNGIQLAEQWPPEDLDPKSAEPMPVPYLEKKNIPAVIPINIGRQLFVDDFLIESTDLARTFHRAEKFHGNPVFKSETRHELEPTGIEGEDQAVTYLGHGGVFYNPEKKHFEMFHTASWRGGLALATSKDLIHWERPDLGVYQDNIILPPGPGFAGKDNAIWLDLAARDPAQRYKAIIQRGKGHTLHTSPNGLVWSQGVAAGDSGDYSSFFHNPFRNVWVQSIKRNNDRGRARYYHEHRDFLGSADRDKSVYWTNTDKLDPPDPEVQNTPQLYSLNAVAYESILLGEHYVLLGPWNRVCEAGRFPKITELHLGFSRDGFHWSRPADRRPFIAATRKDGDPDRGYIHGTNGVMLVHEDKLWFPYCAYSGLAPNGHRGMYTGATISMATLRRDGFASMDATDKSGVLTTRPVAFNGRNLFVNVNNPDGGLRVEILDEKGGPIAPFTKENSIAIKADATLTEVTWKGVPDLDAVRGKPVRFRFHLTNGSLYSFWVSPDQKGASGGYLGAGGPAYDGVNDTKGKEALPETTALPTDALQPPEVHTAPVPARYLDENRMFLCGPGIAASKGGRLWVTFKTGDIGEDEDNCTIVITSGDNGKTWSKPVLAIDIDGPLRTNDPGIWTDPNGKVTLMFGQVFGYWDGRGGFWTMTAENGDDENTRWSKPVRLSDGYLKNKPFITRSGEWLYPIEHMGPKAWRGRYAGGAPMRSGFVHPRPELNHANVFISRDQGESISYLSQSIIPAEHRTFQEHMIVGKKDGTLWMLGRIKDGIGEAFSKDQGRTWTTMAPAEGIKGSSSRIFFQRLKSGNLLLIKNGDRIDQKPRLRTHLTAYLSEDDGATWPHQLLLDERRTSYPDAAEDKDGFINIIHDFGRYTEKEVIFHRITEADIRAGKLVNSQSILGTIANKATHETLKPGAYDEWKAKLE